MLMQQRLHLTSASGIISLLDDQLPEMKIFALDRLNSVVDEFWAEISEVIPKIEILYEDESFPHRQLAALVASQVYYHLGSFEDSLTFALGAGSLFNVNSSSEYVDTVISKSIDHYTKLRLSNVGKIANQQPIDPRLEDIVNRMFQRCFTDGQFKQAIGIALETRRMDIFERAILESGDLQGMLAYAFKITMSLIDNLKYRNEVLKILVNMYKNLQVPDFISMVQCLIFLDDDKSIAELLDRLTRQSHESALMAYQIAFDLYESATQQFLARITESLRLVAPISSLISTVKNASSTAAATTTTASSTSAASGGSTAGTSSSAEPEKMETDVPAPPATESPKSASAPPSSATELKKEDLPEDEKRRQDRIENLVHILTGDTSIELDLQFLIRNNKTDLLILKNTKDAVRNSVCHNATVIANGLMHCGTTSDQFLRDNLDWLSRAVNWAKFSATASLGVIHKRHEKEALHLMSSYLPKDNGPGSGYTEGGGLYALGLIHANHGGTIIDYLLNQLKGATVEAVKHGGCLGLGLAAMGTHRNDVYEQLKYNLYQDDAVTGEAAGIAMGLVMLGSNSTVAIQDMVAYAQETQHEKILRGLAIGISLIMFTRLEEADVLIDTLCRDKDPLLRRSGMHTIAMAYCGTGNNQAIRKLLHVAVSDVNDDVRRAAVEALGFILFRTPEQCPSVVSLLSESFNPHVRYGAAMALGISCAGTGNKEALALLEPMTNDPINFVRQGALISSSLILIQQTEALCSKVKEYRALYQKVISDKHDDLMAKFGAILAQGIIDAGGRNATVSLQSRTGHTNLPAVVGMLVFTQFWYWFPLAHFISLTFTPTALIGLNSDLKMPKIEYRSSAKPSLYGYPAPLEEKKEKEREKVLTAVLSITAKAKKKEAEKKKEEKMDVDEAPPAGSPPPAKPSTSEDCSSTGKDGKKAATTEEAKTPKVEEKAADKAEDTKVVTEVAKDKPKDEAAKPKSEKESEPTFEMLSNPARVMPAQLKVLSMAEGCRYAPMKPLSIGGIILMADSKSGDAEDLVEPVQAGGPKVEEEKEPEPPEPFEYIE